MEAAILIKPATSVDKVAPAPDCGNFSLLVVTLVDCGLSPRGLTFREGFGLRNEEVLFSEPEVLEELLSESVGLFTEESLEDEILST